MEQEHPTGPCRTGRGLILGKFMPPHRGHEFLVNFARSYVRDLTVLVCSLGRELICGELRYRWMREIASGARVVHLTDEVPQEPHEHPDFWTIWRELIVRVEPQPIDFVFASEDYGWKLAEVLGAQYVPVDHARRMVPVSATQIRNDPLQHWEMLPECVRPHYVRRVCLFGPESTGKSRLAERLARRFNTVHAWEYARPLLDFRNGVCDEHDIPRIARGQLATEDALARRANRVLFCDTDLLTTVIWSETLFGACPEWIRNLANQRRYDLYLLLDVDVPWVSDGQRFFSAESERKRFFERCRGELERDQRPFQIIGGTWNNRFEAACDAVAALLNVASPA